MIELIKAFFDELLGFSLDPSIYQILAFTLVSTLFTGFFSIFMPKYSRLWTFALYVCIGVIALLAISSSTVFNLNFGG